MLNVVINTSMENTKVHIGSTIFQSGCKIKYSLMLKLKILYGLRMSVNLVQRKTIFREENV